MEIARVLTVAGSDSGGGAGIQADLKTFCAMGVYGMSAITAVTAQNTRRVHGVEGLSSDFVALQIEAVLADIGVDAVKTGMLLNAAIVRTVARKLSESRVPHVVVDPVMVTTSGDPLLEESAVEALKTALLPEATLVTPNLSEAQILAKMTIQTIGEMETAARRIHELGCGAVLVKGGHLTGEAVDVLYDGHELSHFSAPRIDSRNTHGTGCTTSAAIAALLARGLALPDAVRTAKAFVTEAIRTGLPLGKGHGPLNHFVSVQWGRL